MALPPLELPPIGRVALLPGGPSHLSANDVRRPEWIGPKLARFLACSPVCGLFRDNAAKQDNPPGLRWSPRPHQRRFASSPEVGLEHPLKVWAAGAEWYGCESRPAS
jgi:hypothetical protein